MFGIQMNPPFKNFPLLVRIPLMFCMFIFNISVVQLLAVFAAQKLFGIEDIAAVLDGNFAAAGGVNAFLFVQAVSSAGGFILTAMMFSVLESGEFKKHLGLTVKPSLKMVLLAIVAVIVAQFFIEFLVTVNRKFPLPESLKALDDMQKRAAQITEAMMNFKDVGHLIVVSFVVALIPAIGEEFFFRGLLLGDMLKGKMPALLAILLTGLLFALTHFEYDNTLAIWALGSFLGYLYYISGSLWLPVAAHFTNNFLAVLMKYLFNLGKISKEVAEAETPLYVTIVSIVIFAGLVLLFNKWKKPGAFNNPADTHSPNHTYTA